MKRTITFLLTALLIIPLLIFVSPNASAENGDIIILYTNDVHCATKGYAPFAAYRAQLISEGNTVITVDAGDALQGEMIGALTEGSAIADIMNNVGYDIAIPGNHEFDYKVETLLNISTNEAKYDYICANFYDIINEKTVFKPYVIKEIGEEKIAFVGIATPETYSKSTPTYFQDENGNFIYDFREDCFYEVIQDAVNSALSEGATKVVAIGHLGINGTTEGWRSTDVIANTYGIDAFIDAHAHEIIEQSVFKNIKGEDVILSSTGTKFNYFGKMTISENAVTTELISPDVINIDSLSQNAKDAYDKVNGIVNGYNSEFEYLFEEIGESEVKLAINDENGKRIVRSDETNAANFVTDAYKSVTGADVAFVNGGGVRSEIPIGKFTRKAVMDINPWNNEMCVIEVSGRQLLDALEYGMHATPTEFGSFTHVSGVTFEVHTYIPTPVTVDEQDNCIAIDNEAPRRVRNVKVNGVALDLNKKYTVAGSSYMLQLSGFTMFKDARVVQDKLPTDTEMLVEYVTNHLDGKITSDKYGNIYGDGRIVMIEEPIENEPIVPGDESNTAILIITATLSILAVSAFCKKRYI